ncbi:MAG TPA: ferredoxin--NADP(+) reductase [Alphaproteobacteria bacterium]|nr:MAG: ferredoxin--NADP reductase [SAR116 cluster bacterium]HBQ22118.1 ferredoxin--NADP(+) reductase [Alphaproteobacteria bacterium]HCY47064.1 ferredoxin--NADP(+) reductase [Alphaproteobacteria bacterium]|tara:strand:- start:445 stop:1233 length:789 start_codon:yes stop_codon:yes gene_type:complete
MNEAPQIPDNVFGLTVQEIEHYTDRLFRFRTNRPQEFRFRSGEFVMIGLPGLERVWRAYSVASPSWDDALEFYSIKVPDGPLTSQLQHIDHGDLVLMKKKPTGTLVHDALIPGKRLYLFSTGTGLAPFASIIRDPETYEKFDQVVVTHTCRINAELAYGAHLMEEIKNHEFLGDMTQNKLIHFASTTREEGTHQGRITDLIDTGKLFELLDLPPLDPECDRVMMCGSMPMIQDTKELVEQAGLSEGSNSRPGQFVVERAFAG